MKVVLEEGTNTSTTLSGAKTIEVKGLRPNGGVSIDAIVSVSSYVFISNWFTFSPV